MTTTTDTPRIYVASLSDYNAGILHGAWIDVTDYEDTMAAIHEMLAKSPYAAKYGDVAEEWSIHDYEGFHGFRVSESHDIEALSRLVELLEEHGEAFALWCENQGDEYCQDDSDFTDHYHGCWESEQHYAEESICDEVDQLPSHLGRYFDYEAYAHDLFMDGHYSLYGDEGYHVFSN